MISRSIQIAANGIISFCFIAKLYSMVFKWHILLTHSSVSEHLGYLHVLAIVNKAVKNIGMPVPFWIIVL